MTTRDEVAAALANMFTPEGVATIGVDLAMDLADPLWRVAEAARAMFAQEHGICVECGLVGEHISDADKDCLTVPLRAALADLDAKLEETK